MNDRYCFIHVPKAAGTSIIELMRAALGPQNVMHVHTLGTDLPVPLEYLATRYQAIAGHFELADLPDWIFENTFTFTFLRDPVDRVISNYFYYRNVAHERKLPEMVAAERLDLKSLLRQCDPARPSVWSNWQSMIFSGLRHDEYAPGRVLEPAQRNLQRLGFIGFYEELHASVSKLIATCGWPDACRLPEANRTPRKVTRDVDEETIALIRELNRVDIELYDFAKRLPERPSTRRASATDQIPPAGLVSAPAMFERAERGTREIVIHQVIIRGKRSQSHIIDAGDTAEVAIRGESQIACSECVAGIAITNKLGFDMYGTNTHMLGQPLTLQPGEQFKLLFSFNMDLAPGDYQLTVALHPAGADEGRAYHWIDNACVFTCREATERTYAGLVNLRGRMVRIE